MLRVADSGKGMSPETRAHLFEPFFTTKPQGEGTGLGLSIVYGAVHQAGGEVEVTSQPDSGTVFTLYFPIAHAAGPAPIEDEAPSPRARPGESVLLVEDDDQVRRATQRALKNLGYEVYSARNLGEALERVKFAPSAVSLLLTDVVLPGSDGVEVRHAIERTVPGIPVLFISGFPDEVLGRHGVELEAVLPKPITPEALGRKVRQVIDAARR
jgi:CheY-like chemotaxis protein